MTSVVSSYKALTHDLGRTISRLSDEPQTKREVEYYRRNIGTIKSVEDFMGNQRIFNFAMTAFGMKDLIYAKGMIRKVLNDGLDDPKAFSLNLTDQRFREFAEAFNFKRYGSAATAFDRTQQGTIDKYLRNALEERAGADNEALRLALYFERKAPEITSQFSILADRAVYTVVRTALGLPDAIAGTDIEKQAKLLASRIDVADFTDPTKRAAFISRFLALSDSQTDIPSNSPAVALYAGTSGRIEMNTLLSLQSLKKFGK